MLTTTAKKRTLKLGVIVLGMVSTYGWAAPPLPPHPPYLDSNITDIREGELWKMEVFIDSQLPHPFLGQLETICFVYDGLYSPPDPSQDKYKWCDVASPSFGWAGVATKEGDQVFMHNDQGKFYNGAQWELTSKDEGAGHWRLWENNFFFDLNVIFTRIGKPCRCQ